MDKEKNDIFELNIPVTEADSKPVPLISQHCKLTNQRIKTAMHRGAVWLTRGTQTKRLRRISRPLQIGEILHLNYNPSILDQSVDDPLLIADQSAYSVWFKPYGMLCQGSKWGDHCTLNRWVETHDKGNRPAIILHRLDRATSGLVLLAHNKTTARSFTEIFKERAITKRYRARVEGVFSTGQCPVTIDSPVQDKPAVSHVLPIEIDHQLDQSVVQITIETGRKHQIRQHLASIGHPVVGDRLYGAKDQTRDLQLCATYLAFTCPVKNEPVEYQLPRKLCPL